MRKYVYESIGCHWENSVGTPPPGMAGQYPRSGCGRGGSEWPYHYAAHTTFMRQLHGQQRVKYELIS
jgi:hypothetical protein